MSITAILAITMALGGGWGIVYWLPRRKVNRYVRRWPNVGQAHPSFWSSARRICGE